MTIVSDRAKYRDYTIRVAEDSPSPVAYQEANGRLARFHYRIFRVPSRKEFLLRHFTGATREDRERAERSLEVMPHGHWADFAERLWRKRRNSQHGHYYWVIELGHYVPDPLVQLELEMMIDLDLDDEDEHGNRSLLERFAS